MRRQGDDQRSRGSPCHLGARRGLRTLRRTRGCERSDISLYSGHPFVVYMNVKDPTPSQELHSREALAPVFADLNKYAATMHFVGQSTILTLTNDRATGEASTIAQHLPIDGAKR